MISWLKHRCSRHAICWLTAAFIVSCGSQEPMLPQFERGTKPSIESTEDKEQEKTPEEPPVPAAPTPDKPAPDTPVPDEAPPEKKPPAPAPRKVGPFVPDPSLQGGKVLLMHYMPWYETPEFRGYWGPHWTGHQKQHDPEKNGPDGHPDIWSHYHPLIGLYDSTDPYVLECHLLQMKLAGVNGVIADWYGIARAADYPSIHAATQALFRATRQVNLFFAACYEDRTVEYLVKLEKLTEDTVGPHLTETFQWMATHWFEKENYYKLQGNPLLLNFGPMFIKDAELWQQAHEAVQPPPKLFALHHLWQGIRAEGGFSWVHWNPWEVDRDTEAIKAELTRTYRHYGPEPDRFIASAFPGFNDVYENSHRVLDHRDGQTLRESLAAAIEGPWPLVQLVTWNDYGEGTMIEPTHEFGYSFLEIIQEARKKELGENFTYTKDDLRLPARLLALRKAGAVPQKTLDSIADLLAAGDTGPARDQINQLEQQ